MIDVNPLNGVDLSLAVDPTGHVDCAGGSDDRQKVVLPSETCRVWRSPEMERRGNSLFR